LRKSELTEVKVSPKAEMSEVEIARAMITALSSGDFATFLDHMADDVTYESPFYASLANVHGREAFRTILDQLSILFSTLRFEIVDAFSADANRVILECRGDSTVASTGAPYRNHYLMILRFDDGEVVEWREFSNPVIYQQSMAVLMPGDFAGRPWI
jgi:ketosteroid isomerase-like protein